MNVPLLSDITEQIALFLFITVDADQKRKTTPFSALSPEVLWTDLPGQVSAPLTAVLLF